MSKKIKTIKDIEKIFNELEEKLGEIENIDENTDLNQLTEELKQIQKDLDIEE